MGFKKTQNVMLIPNSFKMAPKMFRKFIGKKDRKIRKNLKIAKFFVINFFARIFLVH